MYRCIKCRKLEGLHYRAVPAPPLPDFRVQEATPFTYCGVDFAGPLYIKASEESESKKVWICLFTCCVTRGIHLEFVTDMSTQPFSGHLNASQLDEGRPHKLSQTRPRHFPQLPNTLRS